MVVPLSVQMTLGDSATSAPDKGWPLSVSAATSSAAVGSMAITTGWSGGGFVNACGTRMPRPLPNGGLLLTNPSHNTTISTTPGGSESKLKEPSEAGVVQQCQL